MCTRHHAPFYRQATETYTSQPPQTLSNGDTMIPTNSKAVTHLHVAAHVILVSKLCPSLVSLAVLRGLLDTCTQGHTNAGSRTTP